MLLKTDIKITHLKFHDVHPGTLFIVYRLDMYIAGVDTAFNTVKQGRGRL